MTFNPQPKPVKKKKGRKRVTDPESWYMGQVAELPCIITGRYGVVVHHFCHGRRGRGKFNGWSCIPLVPQYHDRHQPLGIHESKNRWKERHGPDWSYIPQTLKAIYGDQWSVDH